MGPTRGPQDPGGPHVDHVNLTIWETACEHHICCALLIQLLPGVCGNGKLELFLYRATKSNEGIYMMAAILLQSCHSIKSTRKLASLKSPIKTSKVPVLYHNTILLLRLRSAATILAQSTWWWCCDSYIISARRLSWHVPLPCIIVARHIYCVLPLKSKWRLYIVHTNWGICGFQRCSL